MVIELEETMLSIHCLLPCPVCGTTTKHVLAKSKEFYSCSCGSIVEIELKEIENETV